MNAMIQPKPGRLKAAPALEPAANDPVSPPQVFRAGLAGRSAPARPELNQPGYYLIRLRQQRRQKQAVISRGDGIEP